jgi:hypothetical protein
LLVRQQAAGCVCSLMTNQRPPNHDGRSVSSMRTTRVAPGRRAHPGVAPRGLRAPARG